jgi:hypothetical protein
MNSHSSMTGPVPSRTHGRTESAERLRSAVDDWGRLSRITVPCPGEELRALGMAAGRSRKAHPS